jgi:hypothetical protein
MVYPATQRLLEAAFPGDSAHWTAWASSRPTRARASKTRVLEGQASLWGADVTASQQTLPRSTPEPPLRS